MGIDVSLIKELREATGAGVLDAKKALESTGGDFEAAVLQLREKGLAKAAKRAGRETNEGRVEARTKGTQSGLLVEVNCETDFVGKNEGFIEFANHVADHLFATAQEGQPLDELLQGPFVGDEATTPAELLQSLISSTGENMAVRRYVRFDLGNRPGLIEMYVHPGNRVAVMLELNGETAKTAARDAFVDFAHDLALHIAAQAPVCVSREQLPADTLAAEKETYRKQALDEGKPEAIVERIVEGRMTKYYESTVLLEQPFVKDDKVKVADLFKQIKNDLGENVTLSRFARYELGEPLD